MTDIKVSFATPLLKLRPIDYAKSRTCNPVQYPTSN